jgi:hypothetical protein
MKPIINPVEHRIESGELLLCMNQTYPVTTNRIIQLIHDFIAYKKKFGSRVEQKLYQNITHDQFIYRLITKRPYAFFTSNDRFMLRNGRVGCGGFERIGTDSEYKPFVLSDYMSYDEMCISAFLSMSNYTKFFNNGNRFNCGKVSTFADYEPYGILIGQVGARFEKPRFMEWNHMVIDKHTVSNDPKLNMWAKFYELNRFPDLEMARSDPTRFVQFKRDTYLDTLIYSKRIKYNAWVFLNEANERAKQTKHKKAFCHIVGLGLGVWKVHEIQEKLTVEAYLECLKQTQFKFIDTLYFAWFHYKTPLKQIGEIHIRAGKREPAASLNNENLLLVTNYAWDANAYPGNEYWMHLLSASGDPAAACSSFIAVSQNPGMNKNLSPSTTKYY